MNLQQAILIVLQSFPAAKIDHDEVGRIERLQVIAQSINAAAERATCRGAWAIETCRPIAKDPVQVAAELTWLAKAETDLASNVHREECQPWECDPHKFKGIIIHAAHNLWQMHCAPSWTAERCQSIQGADLEHTTAAAWEAAVMLAGGRGVCRTIEGAFARYAGNGGCTSKRAAGRAAATGRIRGRLLGLVRQEER